MHGRIIETKEMEWAKHLAEEGHPKETLQVCEQIMEDVSINWRTVGLLLQKSTRILALSGEMEGAQFELALVLSNIEFIKQILSDQTALLKNQKISHEDTAESKSEILDEEPEIKEALPSFLPSAPLPSPLNSSELKDSKTVAKYIEVTVPANNHSLFWAAALGVLLPILDDKEAYNNVYNQLFGPISVLKEEIREYLFFRYFTKNTALLTESNESKILEQLVCVIFRGRVVNEMIKNKEELEAIAISVGSNLEEYERTMRQSACGGEPEMHGIAKLLGISIQVSGQLLEDEDAGRTLLRLTNAKESDENRHYNIELPKKLFLRKEVRDAYVRRIDQQEMEKAERWIEAGQRSKALPICRQFIKDLPTNLNTLKLLLQDVIGLWAKNGDRKRLDFELNRMITSLETIQTVLFLHTKELLKNHKTYLEAKATFDKVVMPELEGKKELQNSLLSDSLQSFVSDFSELKDSKKVEKYVEMKVPGDNHCLFWAAALGLLLPTLDNNKDFDNVYSRLFGEEEHYFTNDGNTISVQNLRKTIKEYLRSCDPTKNIASFPQSMEFKELKSLVCIVFRNRVFDTIIKTFDSEKRQVIAASVESSVKKYEDNMRESGWGGEPEMHGIAKLLEISIQVNGQFLAGEEVRPALRLIHTNDNKEKSSASNQNNHYNVELPTELLQKLKTSAEANWKKQYQQSPRFWSGGSASLSSGKGSPAIVIKWHPSL
jgi:hypothetical protein